MVTTIQPRTELEVMLWALPATALYDSGFLLFVSRLLLYTDQLQPSFSLQQCQQGFCSRGARPDGELHCKRSNAEAVHTHPCVQVVDRSGREGQPVLSDPSGVAPSDV